jgi:hypothetical protein
VGWASRWVTRKSCQSGQSLRITALVALHETSALGLLVKATSLSLQKNPRSAQKAVRHGRRGMHRLGSGHSYGGHYGIPKGNVTHGRAGWGYTRRPPWCLWNSARQCGGRRATIHPRHPQRRRSHLQPSLRLRAESLLTARKPNRLPWTSDEA